jgi:hippurate hydrolase
MAAEVEIRPGYPVTVNHAGPAAEVLELAGGLVGERRTYAMPAPVMGAEDFSYLVEQVPGAMAFLGTRPAGVAPADVAPNHSNKMVLDEGAMDVGVALHTAVALRRLAPA